MNRPTVDDLIRRRRRMMAVKGYPKRVDGDRLVRLVRQQLTAQHDRDPETVHALILADYQVPEPCPSMSNVKWAMAYIKTG